jgi:glycosyltransferase involved in cell wall biosynthesis
MKILASAVACHPYGGSEIYFGWSAVKCLAQDHQLWVITTGSNKPLIEKAQTEGLIPSNVRFAYAGRFITTCHPNRMLARIQSWQEYMWFTKDSLRVARELHEVEKFDLVQHITYSTWRVASPMWQLDIPFVYGPIAGNELFPFRFFPILSWVGAAFELARKTSNVVARFSPKVRRSIRRADHVFAVTQESEQLVKTLRGSNVGVSQLSPGFYSPTKAAEFSRFVPEKKTDGILRLYAAGNLGGQKCIALAFHALTLVKKNGAKFRYLLGANGPEISYLKKLVVRLDLTQEVIFGDAMSRADYQQELGNTHIYLLPSMRETVGLTMMEAMLAGCVPIVADNGGPRITVMEDCGYKIPVSTPKRMAEAIAKVIISIDRDRKIISEIGAAASKRIAQNFTEENYRQAVNAVYLSVTRSRH